MKVKQNPDSEVLYLFSVSGQKLFCEGGLLQGGGTYGKYRSSRLGFARAALTSSPLSANTLGSLSPREVTELTDEAPF